MNNKEIAAVFFEIADLLELQGVAFKPRAYRKAAQQIETLDKEIEEICKEGKLRNIPGIGEAIAKKISELIDTGKLHYLEKLREEIPKEVAQLMEIQTLGPKTIYFLYKELGIDSLEKLKKACNAHELAPLKGFGEKTEENILKGIELMERSKGRYLLREAYGDAIPYLEWMKQCKAVEHVSIAGSSRRMKETIGDIDLLVASNESEKVMQWFVDYPQVKDIIAHGKTKSSVRLADDTQIDLRVITPGSWGAALQYFTGSKAHNVKLRQIAIKKGLKLNEYGIFEKDTNRQIGGKTEEEVYKILDLPWIPPELREDRGEVEVGQKGKLPQLIKAEDIKGDFHLHTRASDGTATLEEIVATAQKMGYKFITISDHSQSLRVAHGLSEEKLIEQIQQIEKLNEHLDNFRVFSSNECDIKSDGKLDYPSHILNQLDFVIGAIHTKFKLSEEEMTQRIIDGISNDKVKILAHPTGRVLGQRDPYKINLERIFEACLETNTFLELNAFPDRLDLNDLNLLKAKEKEIKIAMGTDAHSLPHLRYMQFGVATARRGWLEKQDVINTYPLKEIEKMLT
jgi:DNA polymerase (family 10)